jgi:hypothetical protein
VNAYSLVEVTMQFGRRATACSLVGETACSFVGATARSLVVERLV